MARSTLGCMIWFLVLLAFGNASVLKFGSVVGNSIEEFGEEYLPEYSSSCFLPCDSEDCGERRCTAGEGNSRRHLTEVSSSEGVVRRNESEPVPENTIWKRLFRYNTASNKYAGDRNPTQSELSRYLPDVFNKGGESRYFGHPLSCINEGTEQAVMQQKKFGKKPFQIMTGGLHGCTMVTLVSKRAVWQAHFWEVYSVGYQNSEAKKREAFRQRVLNAMRGIKVENPLEVRNSRGTLKSYITPDGPAIDPKLFNRDDDETALYIMTPTNWRNHAEARYPKRMKEVQEEVASILGRSLRSELILYKALNYNDPEDFDIVNQSHRGMCLFQYDPNSDKKGLKAWRLFIEDNFKTGKV